ncbi:transcriptional regulator [Thiocapsa imhoffii]|uniref:Transcriptional regulator n=1 Tax=Thiocapsa imhoffii TaxID=382777 RepID=A0A9X0WGN5_9GAMM|nr:RNA-binding domain-containing protein [Thiocapsa imhoffii]MBK1644203.1 transcriptional regulator [Thiocapsa imhoffii]
MLKSDLLQLIANGENSGIEFKRDDLRPEQLAKEIVAIANLKGGSILLGVEDDGSISGIQRADLEQWVMDTVFGRYVHPMILPFFEVVALDDGKRVAVLTLTEGPAKPYAVRHNDREEIFVRVGSTSRRATREQLARLFESGGMLHAELLPVSGTALVDLDRARLEDYLVRIVGDPAAPTDNDAWHQRLIGLGFMVVRNDGPPVCSIAGLVLFGHSPRRKTRYAGVRWMSFDGTDMTYQAQDDSVIDGPLVALWTGDHSQPPVAPGLVERLTDRMKPFIRVRSEQLQDHLRRDVGTRFAPEAVREALLNALVHRDWTRPMEVEVVNYADRLEITSPGALQNAMTVEKMLAGQRSARNPVIMEVMRDYGYVEQRGMGVRRKIVPLTRDFAGRDAVFEATDDFLRVSLPARRSSDERTLNADQPGP